MSKYSKTSSDEMRSRVTAEVVRAALTYDPRAGSFVWNRRPEMPKAWNTKYAGADAGCSWTPKGAKTAYRVIRILDYPFLAHQVAWLYMTGHWPDGLVDHADMNGLNNRWNNLRPASRVQNSANAMRKKNNKSGFKGVSKCSHSNRWRANISLGGKQTFLGNYDTPEQAHAAYVAAASKAHGEFARSR